MVEDGIFLFFTFGWRKVEKNQIRYQKITSPLLYDKDHEESEFDLILYIKR